MGHLDDMQRAGVMATQSPNPKYKVNTIGVNIPADKTLDSVIDNGNTTDQFYSDKLTKGYAKDTDLTDGTINARFDTLTANEYHVTIVSSSVMYANGSNKLGNSADDRHEFTGSILVGGDVLGNFRLNQATASIQFATASLNTQTGSQGNLNAQIGIATASLNTTTASLISTGTQLAAIMAYTASLLSVKLHSGSLVNYANDAAAAAGGVPVGNLYHTTGTVKVRLT